MAGHAVIFMEGKYDGSYIIDLERGDFEAMKMREEDGNYVLDCWVPPAEAGEGDEDEGLQGAGFARQP